MKLEGETYDDIAQAEERSPLGGEVSMGAQEESFAGADTSHRELSLDTLPELNKEGLKGALIPKSLYESGAQILEGLEGDINAGNYAVILGDDASGRIAALILGDVIKTSYHQHGYEPPAIRFVAGSGQRSTDGISSLDLKHKFFRYRKKKKLDTYAKKLNAEFGFSDGGNRKLLLVTDVIATGNSLTPLAEALGRHGIPFDVAAFAGPDYKSALEEKWNTRIFEGSGCGSIYSRPDLSGVEKNIKDLHAHPTLHNHTSHVPEARADAKDISRQLSAWFLGTQDEKPTSVTLNDDGEPA